jgi:hypothetical protein
MAKTWKDNPNKWKRNNDFQKKRNKKNKGFHTPLKSDEYESAPNMDYDPPDFQQDR